MSHGSHTFTLLIRTHIYHQVDPFLQEGEEETIQLSGVAKSLDPHRHTFKFLHYYSYFIYNAKRKEYKINKTEEEIINDNTKNINSD